MARETQIHMPPCHTHTYRCSADCTNQSRARQRQLKAKESVYEVPASWTITCCVPKCMLIGSWNGEESWNWIPDTLTWVGRDLSSSLIPVAKTFSIVTVFIVLIRIAIKFFKNLHGHILRCYGNVYNRMTPCCFYYLTISFPWR